MKLLISAFHQREYGARFARIAPGLEQVAATEAGELPDLADVEVIFYGGRGIWLPGNANLSKLVELPALKWLQTITTGVDDPRFQRLLARGVAITNSPDAPAPSVAQLVLAQLLRVVKQLDLLAAQQRDKVWKVPMISPATGELTGMTAGIVGLGHVGQEVARLCKAVGMQVIGCRRGTELVAHVDELVPLDALLARAAFVILCVPLTAETKHLIDARAIARMRPEAWLVNVARGQIVDDAALVAALREQRIAGACLDVFEREPLPADDPYWTLPNVYITPHNAPSSMQYARRCTEAFERNLARYVAGEPLLYRAAPPFGGAARRE